MIDDATVVRKLAEREGKADLCHLMKLGYFYSLNYCGYTASALEAGVYTRAEAEAHARGCSGEVNVLPCQPPPYLTSRDALAPILGGLSEEEWSELAISIVPVGPMKGIARRLLTLPPRDLAYAIAEALTPTIRSTPENTLQKNP
jgi:hypothetical protein